MVKAIDTHFASLIGNQQIQALLQRLVETEKIAPAYLFFGLLGVGKSLFAKAFAKALLVKDSQDPTALYKLDRDNHPDLRIFAPIGKGAVHSIDTMRQLRQEARLPPFIAKRKVLILQDADRMQTYSANALLKTFEEPLSTTVILLVATQPEKLLPTVVSRCMRLRFAPIEEQQISHYLGKNRSLSPSEAGAIASLAQGSLGRALELLEEKELRTLIVERLSQGRFSDYTALLGFLEQVNKKLEALQQKREKSYLEDRSLQDLPALQKHQFEQEALGTSQTLFKQNAADLFDLIFSWYRDLTLIKCGQEVSYLINKDCQQTLQKIAEKVELPPLDEVHVEVETAKKRLDRAFSFTNCLENLLLSLGFC